MLIFEVFRYIFSFPKSGDTILVKASRAMEFPEIVEHLRKEEIKS